MNIKPNFPVFRLERQIAELMAKIQGLEAGRQGGEGWEGVSGLKVEVRAGEIRGAVDGDARTLNPLFSPGLEVGEPTEPGTPPTGGVEMKLLALRKEHEHAQVRKSSLSCSYFL